MADALSWRRKMQKNSSYLSPTTLAERQRRLEARFARHGYKVEHTPSDKGPVFALYGPDGTLIWDATGTYVMWGLAKLLDYERARGGR